MDRRDQAHAPWILGITGPIGCGKTTVGAILLDLGAIERIDADRVVHRLMAPGTTVTARISERFPAAVKGGEVDRAALGRIVFDDPAALRELENITHPAVRQEIRGEIEGMRGRSGVLVVDAVKLLQSDLLPLVDEVWLVRCDPNVQRCRLAEDRGMSTQTINGRLAAQPLFEHERVIRVIDNSSSLAELRRTVRDAWDAITQRAR